MSFTTSSSGEFEYYALRTNPKKKDSRTTTKRTVRSISSLRLGSFGWIFVFFCILVEAVTFLLADEKMLIAFFFSRKLPSDEAMLMVGPEEKEKAFAFDLIYGSTRT